MEINKTSIFICNFMQHSSFDIMTSPLIFPPVKPAISFSNSSCTIKRSNCHVPFMKRVPFHKRHVTYDGTRKIRDIGLYE